MCLKLHPWQVLALYLTSSLMTDSFGSQHHPKNQYHLHLGGNKFEWYKISTHSLSGIIYPPFPSGFKLFFSSQICVIAMQCYNESASLRVYFCTLRIIRLNTLIHSFSFILGIVTFIQKCSIFKNMRPVFKTTHSPTSELEHAVQALQSGWKPTLEQT